MVAAGDAVAHARPQDLQLVGAEPAPEGVLDEQLAAAVEDEHARADQRRERAGQRVEPALGEDHALEPLLGGERAAQDRVLLVDELAEGGLGDRDERQLVRDLEHREVALARGLEQRFGHLLVPEAGAEAEAGKLMVGEQLDELALTLRCRRAACRW